MQHFKTAENIAVSKGVYLTLGTIIICSLTILYKALLNIKGVVVVVVVVVVEVVVVVVVVWYLPP